MRPHTFRAATMAEALEEIQETLGPDALILSVREVPGGPAWQIWRGRAVEVLAFPPESTNLPAETEKVVPTPDPHDVQRRGAGNLTQTMEPEQEPPLRAMQARLQAQGLDDELLARAIYTCRSVLGKESPMERSRVTQHLKLQLMAQLRGMKPGRIEKDRLIFLIGGHGVGKTTLAAKIAKYQMERFGKNVGWISTDTYRITSIAQARCMTEALGVPLEIVYAPEDLEAAIADFENMDLIIVDTNGCNPAVERELIELGAFLDPFPQGSRYLVCPATGKDTDLNHAAAAFRMFQPIGMILTKLDETLALGSAYNIAWRSELQLIYFSYSPGIMEGFEPADPEALVDALFGKRVLR